MQKEKIEKFIGKFPKTKTGVFMSEMTSIKIGGPADLFLEVTGKKDLKDVLKYCLKHEIDFFILGWGKNVVFDDAGYGGLVLKLNMNEIRIGKEETQIVAQAGAYLHEIIGFGHEHGLVGMENLSGIPATLGGAIFGNAGAFGSSTSDFVKKVKAFEVVFEKKKVKEVDIVHLSAKYRNSIAKERKNLIIFEAEIELSKGDVNEAKEKVKEVMSHRNESHPLEFPNAGCVFKNPEGGYAGKLIQLAGLKGMREGGLMVSDKHANFIVNTDNGTFEDYLKLVKTIKEKVKESSGVELEAENIVVKKEQES